MSQEPSVSVIVPVFNGAFTIDDTIQCLLKQSRPPKQTEYLVVDNGSTDGTQGIVKRRGFRLLHESVKGVSVARNRGLYEAQGEVVVCVDSDTLPTRGWLRQLVAPFQDENVHLVAGRMVSYNPATPVERYVEASGLYDPKMSVRREVFPFAIGGNMAVRKSSAVAVGGWSNEMLGSDDIDFSHRVLQAFPSEIAYQEGAIVFHRNRNTWEAFQRQAFFYGQGAARLQRRYPRVAPFDSLMLAKLAFIIARRSSDDLLTRALQRLGWATPEKAEFARCHRFWTWWFWRGFFDVYLRRERIAA